MADAVPTSSYVVGDLVTDAVALNRRGWVVGSFFDPDDGARRSDDLEVKYWAYAVGAESEHRPKSSASTEWTMIVSGAVRAEIGDDRVELRAGQYVVISPGTRNNLVAEILDDVAGVTVKAPSNPSGHRIVP